MANLNRAALYLRVSTSEQTTENQRHELERIAEQRGWEIVAVFEDAGISGAKGRDERPQLDFMLREAARGKFDVLAVWSVDRLGRSLSHLLLTLDELREVSVDLFIHQQGLDTSTPSGRAMFSMLGVFAEFERAMIQERIRAGVARAKASGKHMGRPPKLTTIQRREIRAKIAAGAEVPMLAIEYRCSEALIYKVKKEVEENEDVS